jgi:hypothetical protein
LVADAGRGSRASPCSFYALQLALADRKRGTGNDGQSEGENTEFRKRSKDQERNKKRPLLEAVFY